MSAQQKAAPSANLGSGSRITMHCDFMPVSAPMATASGEGVAP